MGWTFPPSAVRMADLGGWHTGTTAPTPHEGAVWLDTSSQMAPTLKVWLAGAWRTLSGGQVPSGDVLVEVAQTLPALTQAASLTVEQAAVEQIVADLVQTLPSLLQQAQVDVEGEPEQYFANFSDRPLDLGEPDGFVNRWGISLWGIRSSSIDSATVLSDVDTNNRRRLLSWSLLGQPADVELVAKVRTRNSNTGFRNALRARCSGDAGSEQGYYLDLSAAGLSLNKFDSNHAMVVLDDAVFPWSQNTWYWLRLRVDGDHLYGKAWPDGSSEPAGWQLSATDTDYSAGWAGLGHNSGGIGQHKEYAVLGAGLDGASAPATAPS
jgi:hypothetical protein